jgi:hypothetical protein
VNVPAIRLIELQKIEYRDHAANQRNDDDDTERYAKLLAHSH